MYCFQPFCLCTVVLSAVNLPGVPAVASLLLLTTLLLLMFPPALASLMLLASHTVPVVSCAAVGPAVDVFLPLLFRPWSPAMARVSDVVAFPYAV